MSCSKPHRSGPVDSQGLEISRVESGQKVPNLSRVGSGHLTRPASTGPDSTPSNPTRPDPTRLDPTRPDLTRPDPSRTEPSRPDPIRPEPTWFDRTREVLIVASDPTNGRSRGFHEVRTVRRSNHVGLNANPCGVVLILSFFIVVFIVYRMLTIAGNSLVVISIILEERYHIHHLVENSSRVSYVALGKAYTFEVLPSKTSGAALVQIFRHPLYR